MKNATKFLAFFLAVLMIASSMALVGSAEETYPVTWWDEKTTATTLSGAGTEASPYLINTADELAYFAKMLEGGALDGKTEKTYFKLMDNVDMSAHQWRPIGYTASDAAYATHTLNNAVFNGNGKTIGGINLSASKAIDGYTYANGCAFFTKISGASVVQDLTINARILDPAFTAETAAKNRGAAALAATVYDSVQINNVTVNIDMDVSASSGECYYGGLVAYSHNADNVNTAKLNNIKVNGDINLTGVVANTTKLWAGGIVGLYRFARTDSLYNYANITYKAGYGNHTAVGGIAGDSFCGIVGDKIENHGNLNITPHSGGYSYFGGCFGRIPVIRNTGTGIKNYGTITLNNVDKSVDYTGGVIGTVLAHQEIYLNAMENHGDIIYTKNSVQNNDYIGGIVGFLQGKNTYTKFPVAANCLNKGNISVTYADGLTVPSSNQHQPYIGGIIGSAQYIVMDTCVNEGDLTITNTYYNMRVGGITGNIDGAISQSLTSHIKNCTNNGKITVSNNSTNKHTAYVGGITGNFAPEHGTITDTVNNGKIILNDAYGAFNAGGIAGNCSKTTHVVERCTNNGDIISYDKNGNYHRNIGGVIGTLDSFNATGAKIINCTNNGDLTRDNVVNHAYIGGITAKAKNVALTDVKNTGVITMTTVDTGYNTGSSRYVGGIAGIANAGTVITRATNEGLVDCEGEANNWRVAGIVGDMSGTTIESCVNKADVRIANGSTTFYVGGILGNVGSEPAVINNSTNYGNITTEAINNTNGTSYVGGIAGNFLGVTATMDNNANYGDVFATKTKNHYVGGIAGETRVSANTDTTAEMRDLYNEGSVGGVGAIGNAAYGGIIGRISNDNYRADPVHDIVNAVNMGKVQNGSLSGGIIGYAASSRKKINTSDSAETAQRYTVNLRECISLFSGTYGLVGSARCAYMNIENCFTDAEKFMSYYNQDTLYLQGTGITINGTLHDEHYNLGSFDINPTGVTYVELGTLDRASIRLDAFATDESGIRFDSFISKKTYDALKAADDADEVSFEFGTLVAPTDNLNLAKVVASYDKMAALDALTAEGGKMYAVIPYEQNFLSDDADNYYFAGAINKIKDANVNLSFSAIAYLTVEYAGRSFTFYADYDGTNADRARSVAQVAGAAYEDRATEQTVIDGVNYSHPALAENACYLGNWSPYSNTQLALLKTWSNYNNEGKVVPNGLTVNGVSISDYKIVYAQSPIYKTYGSTSGKTLFGDLGNVRMEIYSEDNTPTGQYHEFGDALLGARYDYDKQTAERLRDLIYAEFGVMLEVVPDYEIGADAAITADDIVTPETDYEILVGFTNRAKSQSAVLARMGVDDYTVKIDDSKIIVCGGSYGTTWHAVDALEALFATLEDDADFNLKMAGNLSGTYKMQKIATIGDSITRGSQSLPDGSDFGGASGASAQFGNATVETYFRYFLSYPANLQRLMWKDGVVYNFGRGASTAINRGDSDYYGNSSQWNDCKNAMEDVDFDLVFMQHGTNDAGTVATGGADKETEYHNEVKALMDTILADNPDCKFVMNNVPHAFDGTGAGRNEANDENMRRVQKDTATALKAAGYDVYHYDMDEYTRLHLVNEGATPCPGYDVAGDYRESESAVHGDYYNVHTPTTENEGTHPNFRGYNKMADGVIEVVDYILNNGEKPVYMIDVDAQ